MPQNTSLKHQSRPKYRTVFGEKNIKEKHLSMDLMIFLKVFSTSLKSSVVTNCFNDVEKLLVATNGFNDVIKTISSY